MPTLDLDALCNPPPTDVYTHDPQPIYRFDDYIKLYERHCVQSGYPFDPTRFDPKVYKYEEPVKEVVPARDVVCSNFMDHVRVRLEVEEATEKVTIVVDTILHDLYVNYWSKSDQPPLNELVVAFKKLGADDAFLKKIISRHDKIQSVCKNFDLDKIFKPKSKPKKKKEEEAPPPPPPDDEDEREDDDDEEEEFEGMDVEENEDDEDQGVDDDEFVDDLDEE
jgi:hypothetical protein